METWILNEADSNAFVEILLNPPEPNTALKAAAERYKRRTQHEDRQSSRD